MLRRHTLKTHTPGHTLMLCRLAACPAIDPSSCRSLAGGVRAILAIRLSSPAGAPPTWVSDEELVEIFRAFDLTITYEKHEQRLRLAATITPELLPVLCPTKATAPRDGRSLTA
jgi:hypothetical protein